MKECQLSKLRMVAALAAIGTGLGLSTAGAFQPPRPDGEDGVQVLTRGPVHEAFAETVTFDPEPGIEVNQAPPDAIEEAPPDVRPEGANVTWIPGYWAWDDDRHDFLWVSGIWRALPPGRQWVSGYWGRSSQGFQWFSGYWPDAQESDTEYLPEPPETVEVGPNINAPTADHIWVPGCWVWHHGRYAWRPGYWTTAEQDWDWVPAHYVYAPRGYVFVDGYWDHSVARRGVLFAPVYFDAGVRTRRDYHYSPATVIDLAVFSDHLFVRPRYHHYYFGDYYDSGYRDSGFHASFSFHSNRHGYDPIYSHQRWQHRQDREWVRRVETAFGHRRDHVEARPPRTLAAQIHLSATVNVTSGRERSHVLARSLDQLARSQDGPTRFRSVDPEERQQLRERGREVRQFREERQKVETRAEATSTDRPARESAPSKVRLRRSPIVARSADDQGKDRAPPKRLQAPDPDSKVAPKARRPGGKHGSSKEESKEKKEKKEKDDKP